IVLKYIKETDKKKVINLTNQAYLNLDGEGQGDVLSHILQLPSDHLLSIDENQISLDRETRVAGTVCDFLLPKKIVEDINKDEEQLRRGNGYDHTLVNHQPISQVGASAYSPDSGIRLEVFTTEPGIQLYTGNFLSGKDIGKSGRKYASRS